MQRSPIVYFLFFLSGITALIYEIVWTRMLTLVFGHTVFSISVVLAAFMAGLGLGSYLFGYAADRLSINSMDSSSTALNLYGWVEILIFANGALLSLLFSNFSSIYSLFHSFIPESASLQNLLKIFFSFILMLIPTTLMGATLPLISKYCVTNDKQIGKQISLLYALNTLGAAFGCMVTGFFLMETFGVLQTVLFAAGINLLVGISALIIYKENRGTTKFTLPKISTPKINWNPEQNFWMGISFICGFTALAYEILWTRLLVFSIASTVYSFSMMLAVFYWEYS